VIVIGFSFVGSGIQISAVLFGWVRCLSRQLTQKFSLPPLNHLKYGSFSSYVLSHCFSHVSPSFARSPQNFIGSFAALS